MKFKLFFSIFAGICLSMTLASCDDLFDTDGGKYVPSLDSASNPDSGGTGQDEPVTDLFKDYSFLLGKTKPQVKSLMSSYTPQYEDSRFIDYVLPDTHINFLTIAYSLDEDATVYDTSIAVSVEIAGYSNSELTAFLKSKYGNGSLLDEGQYLFPNGDMYVMYEFDYSENLAFVAYVLKDVWDSEMSGTRSVRGLKNNTCDENS